MVYNWSGFQPGNNQVKRQICYTVHNKTSFMFMLIVMNASQYLFGVHFALTTGVRFINYSQCKTKQK